jgi:hypothetical protein
LGLKAAATAAGTSIGAIMGPAGLVIAALAILATGIAIFAAKAKEAKEETDRLNAAITRTAPIEAMQKEYDKTVEKLTKLQNELKKTEEVRASGEMGPGEYSIVKKRLDAEIDNLTAQRNYIAKNIQMSQMEEALGKTAAAEVAKQAEGLTERNNIVAQYEEKLKLADLELKQGLITEKEASDKRKEALRTYIDGLNGITLKYKSISSETVIMVDNAIKEFKKLNNAITGGEVFENVTWEQYATYKLKIGEELVRSTQDAYKFREQADGRQLANIKTIAQINEEFTESQYNKEIKLIDEKKEAYIAAGVDEVNAENWSNKEKLKLVSQYVQEYISITSNLASQLKDIFDGIYKNQLDRLQKETNAKLKTNNEQYQAALKAAGLEEDTAVESAQKKLNEAIKANDAEAISEAKKVLKKVQIEEEFVKKEEQIKKDSAIKEHQLKVKQFKTDQAFQIAQIIINTASAVVKSLPNLVLSAISAGVGAAQIAIVAGQQPPTLALAEGGIIPARAGGVNATLAEAGKTEVVFPLDKLENFINKGSINNENMGNIELKVYMDSKPFLDTIFPATRNKTVLISAKAVV